MNAASPGVIALFQPNDYYHDEDAYLEALAEAMRPEYEAIVARGSDPAAGQPRPRAGPAHDVRRPRATTDVPAPRIARHVEVLNDALRNVPADRVRMHVCWGNYEGTAPSRRRDARRSCRVLLTAQAVRAAVRDAPTRGTSTIWRPSASTGIDRRRQGADSRA